MAHVKMLTHRVMVAAGLLGLGAATLAVAHATAGACVSLGSLVVGG